MAMKLNMLPPSVNNMSVRVFVRAADIDVEEENVWGQTQGEEYLSKYPPGLTPTIESDEFEKGVLGESCALMMYYSTTQGRDDLYPSDPKKRAMVDAARPAPRFDAQALDFLVQRRERHLGQLLPPVEGSLLRVAHALRLLQQRLRGAAEAVVEEGGGEVDAGGAAVAPQRPQHLVARVARVIGERPRRRVREQ